METRDARILLNNVLFPGDKDQTCIIAVSGHHNRMKLIRGGGTKVDTVIAAAIEIQRLWRGYRSRLKLHSLLESLQSPDHQLGHMSLESCDTHVIQQRSLIEDPDIHKPVPIVWTIHTAAVAIQRKWRSYSDKKVFQHYKELINFHGKGNPSQMLKCINPLEAELLDKASGGFVRFRLGGDRFPPHIYYKIFSHHSIVDMCSFSPRDYTAMCERKKVAQDIHNKDSKPLPQSREGWYQRIENNGWRVISTKSFHSDGVTYDTSRKVVPFHYMKLKRKEDIENTKKRRKIEWMQKMYRDGCRVEQKSENTVHSELSEEAVTEKEEHIEDLLLWSAQLDFEHYITEWQQLATSCVSDDPFALRVTR